MSASTVGILVTIFSVAVCALIFWGGFQEEKRGNVDSAHAQLKR